jgi:hypothetical protein
LYGPIKHAKLEIRPPGFRKLAIILAIGRLAVYPGPQVPVQNEAAKTGGVPTKLIIIRHAERDDGVDPPLNLSGKNRARDLMRFFADSSIHMIFCPDFIRNIQTAKPLADSLGIPIQILPRYLRDNGEALAVHFLKVIKNHPGKTILFIGNQSSNVDGYIGNILAIFQQLNAPEIPLTRYFDFHIIFIYPDGKTRFQHGVYGSLTSQ